ncbi:DUF4097 family beta strand repeat-containing protein [Cohnella sp.]|uniref:DUF4097 family beta strand repeat-containing protein n=1 Tax=Cohnella sp. TaxID=1883426 RepID=UPI003566EF24
MKKLWYLTAFSLVIIGIAGVLSYDWKKGEDLPEFEKKWTFESAELRKLAISSDYDVNIAFVKSTDGANSIFLKGAGTEKMIEKIKSTEISNQSLQLDLVRTPKRFINFFDFSFENAIEEFIISVKDDALLELLELELDSGNIKVIDAANIQIIDAEVSLDSGNFNLNNFKSDQLNIEVDSGNITGDKVTAELTASVDSGNIRLKNATGRSNLSVDSGSISLYKLDTADAEITADSGNVYVQVPSSFAGFYDLQVDSGTVKSPESKRETKDYIKVTTDSGNIKIEQN